MNINVEKLKINVKEYGSLLERYHDIYMKFYYEAESNKKYWNSVNANYFYNLIEEEKKKNDLFLDELYLLKIVFDYIVDNYQNYGEKINLEIEFRDEIINKLNSYKTNDILYALNSVGYVNVERSKAKIRNIEKKVLQYKEKFKKICDDFEKIEDTIRIDLSKILISSVEEISPVIHQLGTVDEIVVDIDNMDISLKKLEFYRNEESVIFDELKEIFDEINYNYITSNSDKLESLELEIISKYKILLNNTINNVKLFNDNLENSRVGIAKSRAILDGIESVDL